MGDVGQRSVDMRRKICDGSLRLAFQLGAQWSCIAATDASLAQRAVALDADVPEHDVRLGGGGTLKVVGGRDPCFPTHAARNWYMYILILPVRVPSCQAPSRVPTRNCGFAADLPWFPFSSRFPSHMEITSHRARTARSLDLTEKEMGHV
jgi:hypothetical protein